MTGSQNSCVRLSRPPCRHPPTPESPAVTIQLQVEAHLWVIRPVPRCNQHFENEIH